MSEDCTPRFSIAEAARLAEECYGVTASVDSLPSERDQNFALRTAGGDRYVFKIAKSDEAPTVLALQNLALKHSSHGMGGTSSP